jgi:hypothetical protein
VREHSERAQREGTVKERRESARESERERTYSTMRQRKVQQQAHLMYMGDTHEFIDVF